MKSGKEVIDYDDLIPEPSADCMAKGKDSLRAITNIFQVDSLHSKVRSAFTHCLNKSEQTILELRYRLDECALSFKDKLDKQPSMVVPHKDALSNNHAHNGNGFHKNEAAAHPEKAELPAELLPLDEIARVCGVTDEVIEFTEANALRKLMGYGKKQ